MTLPPEIANKFVKSFARTIPFDLKIFPIFLKYPSFESTFGSRFYFSLSFLRLHVYKVHCSHAKQYCCNFQLCIKWQISENAQKYNFVGHLNQNHGF
jgi:hypothetical protein